MKKFKPVKLPEAIWHEAGLTREGKSAMQRWRCYECPQSCEIKRSLRDDPDKCLIYTGGGKCCV